MKIKVDRNQYGIGQGCFHAQRIAILDSDSVKSEYRFVYDCGSDTAKIAKYKSPLEWAINHLAGTNKVPEKSLSINSIYISHFEKDHISGISRLVELTNVKEIVIPYLSKDLFISLVIRDIVSKAVSDLDSSTLSYLGILERASSPEAQIFPEIPTVRVYNPSLDGELQPPADNKSDVEDIIIDIDSENSVGDSSNSIWSSNSSRLIRAKGPHRFVDFWELRVWSYSQNANTSQLIKDELAQILNTSGRPELENLLQGKVDLNEMDWAFKNRGKIQDAYERALRIAGVTHSANHNVVSLCLYSGPKFTPETAEWVSNIGGYDSFFPFWDRYRLIDKSAWIATGDALLEDTKVWNEFSNHFRGKIDKCQTLLMPHHGSGKGRNFNPALLNESMLLAVFSAGAFNKYNHPHREVLEAVTDKTCIPIIVNEYMRPGFFESIVYIADI